MDIIQTKIESLTNHIYEIMVEKLCCENDEIIFKYQDSNYNLIPTDFFIKRMADKQDKKMIEIYCRCIYFTRQYFEMNRDNLKRVFYTCHYARVKYILDARLEKERIEKNQILQDGVDKIMNFA